MIRILIFIKVYSFFLCRGVFVGSVGEWFIIVLYFNFVFVFNSYIISMYSDIVCNKSFGIELGFFIDW